MAAGIELRAAVRSSLEAAVRRGLRLREGQSIEKVVGEATWLFYNAFELEMNEELQDAVEVGGFHKPDSSRSLFPRLAASAKVF